MKKLFHSKGFTLIELLVVVAIIGLLASVILASLNTARGKARDAKRESDLNNIQIALEMYYDKYGTYLVAGTGYTAGGVSCGCGFIGEENVLPWYPTAVTRGLYNAGFLSAPIVDDPIQSPGYMIYLCNNNQNYALSATKEYPTAADIAKIQTVCDGAYVSATPYFKNYAVGN
jgi:prepilin-type N-terminal cleavage/methylation domain-containing protein